MKKIFIVALLYNLCTYPLGLFDENVYGQGFKTNAKITTPYITVSDSGFIYQGSATQWDDVTTPAIQTKVSAATSKPIFNYDSLALEFVHDPDSNEIAYYSIQMPHRTKYGASQMCSPHFHYMQYAAGDTTFNVILLYRISRIGGQASQWTYITATAKAALTYAGIMTHQICEFQEIPLVNVSESSWIDFKMYRKDNTGLPATLYVKGFDIHFEFNKLGTPNEYPEH